MFFFQVFKVSKGGRLRSGSECSNNQSMPAQNILLNLGNLNQSISDCIYQFLIESSDNSSIYFYDCINTI